MAITSINYEGTLLEPALSDKYIVSAKDAEALGVIKKEIIDSITLENNATVGMAANMLTSTPRILGHIYDTRFNMTQKLHSLLLIQSKLEQVLSMYFRGKLSDEITSKYSHTFGGECRPPNNIYTNQTDLKRQIKINELMIPLQELVDSMDAMVEFLENMGSMTQFNQHKTLIRYMDYKDRQGDIETAMTERRRIGI